MGKLRRLSTALKENRPPSGRREIGAAAPAAYIDGTGRPHGAAALKAWWPASQNEAYTAS
jgi:hypothetical protein